MNINHEELKKLSYADLVALNNQFNDYLHYKCTSYTEDEIIKIIQTILLEIYVREKKIFQLGDKTKN